MLLILSPIVSSGGLIDCPYQLWYYTTAFTFCLFSLGTLLRSLTAFLITLNVDVSFMTHLLSNLFEYEDQEQSSLTVR